MFTNLFDSVSLDLQCGGARWRTRRGSSAATAGRAGGWQVAAQLYGSEVADSPELLLLKLGDGRFIALRRGEGDGSGVPRGKVGDGSGAPRGKAGGGSDGVTKRAAALAPQCTTDNWRRQLADVGCFLFLEPGSCPCTATGELIFCTQNIWIARWDNNTIKFK
jgi:hypothetical protein